MNYTDPYHDPLYYEKKTVNYVLPPISPLEYKLQDPELDAANELFSDRLRQHADRVRLVNEQLAERDRIGEAHMEEIDKAAMKCGGYLESLNMHPAPFFNQAIESKRQLLARMLLDLEGQKRQEAERCWADKARLQVEALEATVDYESSVRKYRQLML
jgi:hypothetical protein